MNGATPSSPTTLLASPASSAAGMMLSCVLVAAPPLSSGGEPSSASTHRARPVVALTNVQQLLEQTSDELRAKLPVRLRGVITCFDPHFKNLYLHDGTGGCWLQRSYRQTNFAAGQVIEVEGNSGGWMRLAPYPTAIRVAGTAQLPEPKWTTFERLASSAEDAQWVKFQGVVRTMAFRLGLLKIDLAVGADHVPLYVPGFDQKPLPTNLVGAVVEAHGVCSMKGDAEEQLIGFFFHVPGLEQIIVLHPGGSNPYDGVAQPITTLRRGQGFKPDERVKLKGVVTWAGDRWLKGRSFALLLRRPADVVVLKAGPRWTWLDAAKVGAGALLVTAIGLAWVSVLQRQVRWQTAQLSERTGELRAANETLQKEIAVRENAEAHLRQAEQELRGALDKERELNELKTNFVNVVSHEFRTPLGVILSSSEILAHRGPSSATRPTGSVDCNRSGIAGFAATG